MAACPDTDMMRHPDRSRFSGEGRDLARTTVGPERNPCLEML
jgi:hypothetical protein